MGLLSEMIQMLGQPPGIILYHLITLLMLLAISAISIGQWRRDRSHRQAFRFAVGAMALLLGRVVLLVMMLLARALWDTAAVLPLLDQTLNTITVLVMLWVFMPRSDKLPRLNDLVLLMGVLIVLAISLSFLPGWLALAESGVAYYSTGQSTLWTFVQFGMLLTGTALLLLHPASRKTLSPIIGGILLLVTGFHLLGRPALLPEETNIAYWVRLGHLVAFPLWAVMAYQAALSPFLEQEAQPGFEPSWPDLFRYAGRSLESSQSLKQLTAVVQLTQTLVEAPIVAVGAVINEKRDQLHLVSNQPQQETNTPQSWTIQISDWSALQAALNQRQTVELNTIGAGATQLKRFSETLALGDVTALLIYPIFEARLPQGVIILGERDAPRFSDETKQRIAALAAFVGVLLQRRESDLHVGLSTGATPLVSPESDERISGRIIALEQERDTLRAQVETAHNKLHQANLRTAEATQRAQDLAASLEALEQNNGRQQPAPDVQKETFAAIKKERDRLVEKLEVANLMLLQSETHLAEAKKELQTLGRHQPGSSANSRTVELEREVATLRESLEEAEEAMAMAAAGEGEISTEWVMLTITRYSGQLEQAQAQIELLEAQLARSEAGGMDEALVGVLQELRTPMTSISGFTDLLLGGTLGNMGVKQRDMLKRIRANVERMEAMLDQIRQLTPDKTKDNAAAAHEQIDVREAVETAVNSVMTQIREKRIHLDLNLADDLPGLVLKRSDFHQIVTSLLLNACQASGVDGHISIIASARDWVERGGRSAGDQSTFIELKISDSGDGISPEDLAHVFTAHYHPEKPLIAGIGDTTVGLNMAHSLAVANGGRLWVDSEKGKGSIFSLLFPLKPTQAPPLNGSS